MKLLTASIRRYRAFDKRVDIPLQDLTVLAGPNNFGKSTILSALDLFFSVFQHRETLRLPRALLRYQYLNDYPKKWEGRSGRRWPTQIIIILELNDRDLSDILKDIVDNSIESIIEIIVEFRWNERLGAFRPYVNTKGINSKEAHTAFFNWMREYVRYVYIPATRNIQDFRRGVFGELISGALSRVKRSKQRLLALERLFDDVKREVAVLEAELVEELQHYLPSVSSLSFDIGQLDLERLVSVGDVNIDDGARTPLAQKGDGFKSLFTISLLQYIARQRYGTNLIFGIEEPEAHLHSSAIYEIKSTLRSLAKSFQVIITTHSPILIQRDYIQSNVIVEKRTDDQFSSYTRAAKSLAELRGSLGIRPHENMTTAEVVVVVEGSSEECIFPRLLGLVSQDLKMPISNGRCRVLSAGGASNIPAVVRALARDATSCIVFVDADEEGLRSAKKVRESGLMLPSDVFRTPIREGCPETELEDLFDFDLYCEALNHEVGIGITKQNFLEAQRRSGGRGVKFKKWSDVMAILVNQHGIDWEVIKEASKTSVALALSERVVSGDVVKPKWLLGVANRILHYLNEEYS